MVNDFKTAVSLLRRGEAPGNREVLNEISVGIPPFIGFLREKYLLDYIASGGSKIKFLTGRTGSGKTHFLQMLSSAAEDEGFVTVNFSARDVWLHDFKEIYAEIFNRCDLMRCLGVCAQKIIKELGYEHTDVPEGKTFADYLSGLGEFDALTRKEIRNQLHNLFLKDPLIDNNFAVACSLLTGGILGHPALEEPNKDMLLTWLAGGRDIKLAAIRKLGLSPTKITKYNARHMLRSLAEVHSLASFPGILVMIDNADILASSGSLDTIRYTKLKREDAYESIRELIDEIDTLKNIMFIYAFDRKLIDDELSGLKSYQALWMRIQNEIVSNKFNFFTDIIDLDALARIVYTKEALMEISSRLADVMNRVNHEAVPISGETAEEILLNTAFAKESLPRQVGQATIKEAAE